MKKISLIILLHFIVFGFVFGATINSRQGYAGLSWGSTVQDAGKAGYKLTPMNSSADKEYLAKTYTVSVDAYKVTSKDKSVSALQFHYYMGNLFFVTETLSSKDFSQKKLEGRYGNFANQGIYLAGKQYTDASREDGGSVSSISIIISNSNGKVSATMYDWSVYKSISFAGQKLSKASKTSITDELEDMATKLVQDLLQERSGASKPSCAFMPLTTDYKNSQVDNYITDALTEAMFNAGKIKIIERSNLESILEEQKFQSSGLVNEVTAKSIGMIAGVDFVCYGTLKDTGNSFTVNARIVDVETGELCAISRTTVSKDEYLSQQPQSAVASAKASVSSSPASKNTSTVSSAKTVTSEKQKSSASDNAWKVTSYTDIFAGFTKYIFSINSSDSRKLFVSYQKYENAAYNRVISGIYWGYDTNFPSLYTSNSGLYDIKGSTETISKKLSDDWKMQTSSSEKDYFWFAWDSKAGARWLVDILRKSDSVAVRRDGLSRKFQTAGLLDKMAEYGITWKEIDAAMANEEF